MALIDSSGRVIEDRWTYPDATENDEARPWYVIPLDVLTAVASG